MRRYLASAVGDSLERKMVFVGGPRQVGKTTFALGFLGKNAAETHSAYLNWDHPSVRPAVRRAELPPGEPLLLFDEIHKYARWRNLLKGIYDTEKSRRRILVTGSARLDYYRKGGDSLAGRYRYFRLHPYLWDWSSVEGFGPRFENLVASQLLKYCHWIEDTEGHAMELRFLRDTDRREVDFVVLKNRKPLFAVESKSGDKAVSAAIQYFAARTAIPHFYQVHIREKHFSTGKVTVLPFIRFCQELELP